MARLARVIGTIGLAIVASATGACGSDTGDTTAPKQTTLTACDAEQMNALAVDSLSYEDAATVCQTIQNSVGHVPTIRIVKELALAVAMMEMKGDKTPVGDLAYQFMNIVEARGQTTDDAKIYDTFNVVFKIYNGTMGHVTPRDVNVALRAMSPEQAHQISDDGLYGLAAVIQEQKKADGE